MKDFNSFDLPKSILQSLERLNFKIPTPIQEASIPLIMNGRDILASAQTGTGKTGAFGIPLVAKLMLDPDMSGLIITPTRELATQVIGVLRSLLGRNSNINTALLIGGEPISKQLYQLNSKPRLIVGTPGRINDLIERKSLKLKNTKFLVLDETDRMLDMGFSIQIDKIKEHLPKEKQTVLFSATLPQNIIKLAESYLNNPEHINIDPNYDLAKKIKQDILYTTEEEKYIQLTKQLDQRVGSIIVFVGTKYNAEKICRLLCKENYSANAIHGDLRHNKRESVIKGFRNEKYRILVATDIAARGLDIPHIGHVINYDLPQCPEDYIHRIGRTSRAGATGEALCLITPSDRRKWKIITGFINNDSSIGVDNKKEKMTKRSKKPSKSFFPKKFSQKNKEKKSFKKKEYAKVH